MGKKPTGVMPVGFAVVWVFHIEYIGGFITDSGIWFINDIDLIVRRMIFQRKKEAHAVTLYGYCCLH